MEVLDMQKKKMICMCLLASTIFILNSCGIAKKEEEKQGQTIEQTQTLKPGDEGFTFDYTVKGDMTPANFDSNNGEIMVEKLKEISQKVGDSTQEDYYIESLNEGALTYGKVPEKDFWNINPDMPQELYEIPVNLCANGNVSKIISGKELAENNSDKISYYTQTGRILLQNSDNCDYKNLEEYRKFRLRYQMPSPELAANMKTLLEEDCNGMIRDKVVVSAAVITDESLCYIASDGSIRVRGLELSKHQKEGEEPTYRKYYMECSMYPIPEETKKQTFEWEFTDFCYWSSIDMVPLITISEEEFNRLLEQYEVTCEFLPQPEWAGRYGMSQ